MKNWKKIKYDFKTVLGTSPALVEVWDTEEEGIFFKPGEEQRLEKEQAERYRDLVLDKRIYPNDLQVKHLKRVLGDRWI